MLVLLWDITTTWIIIRTPGGQMLIWRFIRKQYVASNWLVLLTEGEGLTLMW